MVPTSRPSRSLLLALALAAACSTAASARQKHLTRELDAYAYPRAVGEVWPEVLRLLHEKGWELVGDDRAAVGLSPRNKVLAALSPGFDTRVKSNGTRILETGGSQFDLRMRAEGIPTGTGGCRVTFTELKREDMNPANQIERRDVELELALLARLDRSAASRIEGHEVAAPVAATPEDPWARFRPLVGSWEPESGGDLRWTFDFAPSGQFLEITGSPVLGPPRNASGRVVEKGVLARDAARGTVVWRQFTDQGQVHQLALEKANPDALVFVSERLEGRPEGSRARLTLGLAGPGELLAILEEAAPGAELRVTAELRLRRQR